LNPPRRWSNRLVRSLPEIDLAGKTVLVFGATGFLGQECAQQADAAGARVIRTSLHGAEATVRCDARDPDAVEELIHWARPDICINAAGTTAARSQSRSDLVGNGLVVWNILRVFDAHGLKARLVVVSSSAVYGGSGTGQIREDHPLLPATDYAASKACADLIATYFAEEKGINAVIGRPFNLVGPREPAGQVCSAIARQIALAEVTGITAIRVGPILPERDFTDVRDAARALILLGLHGSPAEAYNIASGRPVAIKTVLEILRRLSRVSTEVHGSAHKVSGDVSRQSGNHRKITVATGWAPIIGLEQSLADLLEFWRARVTQQPA
jgi:GDP-4-dehydro-6-deoxy-D-mannose reductase